MSSEMRIGFRAVDGLQIRFAESDSSSSQRIVLTSPWPESLLAFERVWPRLNGRTSSPHSGRFKIACRTNWPRSKPT